MKQFLTQSTLASKRFVLRYRLYAASQKRKPLAQFIYDHGPILDGYREAYDEWLQEQWTNYDRTHNTPPRTALVNEDFDTWLKTHATP